MSLNIAALASRGLNKAWALIADQLTACTVRDVPTFTRNTTTGTDTVSAWGVEVSTDADGLPMRTFLYQKVRKEESPEMRSGDQMALVRRADLPGVTELTTAAELVIGSAVWKVASVSMPPGGAVFILTLQQ